MGGEQFIKGLPERVELATYYGVPAYIGKDEEINKEVERLRELINE